MSNSSRKHEITKELANLGLNSSRDSLRILMKWGSARDKIIINYVMHCKQFGTILWRRVAWNLVTIIIIIITWSETCVLSICLCKLQDAGCQQYLILIDFYFSSPFFQKKKTVHHSQQLLSTFILTRLITKRIWFDK